MRKARPFITETGEVPRVGEFLILVDDGQPLLRFRLREDRPSAVVGQSKRCPDRRWRGRSNPSRASRSRQTRHGRSCRPPNSRGTIRVTCTARRICSVSVQLCRRTTVALPLSDGENPRRYSHLPSCHYPNCLAPQHAHFHGSKGPPLDQAMARNRPRL
jgi:hypothetical protein